jgi:hypothetical protein
MVYEALRVAKTIFNSNFLKKFNLPNIAKAMEGLKKDYHISILPLKVCASLKLLFVAPLNYSLGISNG